MRAQLREELDLQDFHGLSVRMRPDDRTYAVSVRADGALGDHRLDDLYQVVVTPFVQHALHADNGNADGTRTDMLEVRLPWGAFALTWRGNLQSETPPAMHLGRITHVGLTLADERAGPFACELGEIAAFRYNDVEMERDPHVVSAIELNERQGYEGRLV